MICRTSSRSECRQLAAKWSRSETLIMVRTETFPASNLYWSSLTELLHSGSVQNAHAHKNTLILSHKTEGKRGGALTTGMLTADDLLKCMQQKCREQVVLFWRVLKFAVVVNREGRLQQTVEQIAGLIEAEKLRVARNHIQWFQTVC